MGAPDKSARSFLNGLRAPKCFYVPCFAGYDVMSGTHRDFVPKWFSLLGDPTHFVTFAEAAGTSRTPLTTLLSIKAEEIEGFGEGVLRLDPEEEPL